MNPLSAPLERARQADPRTTDARLRGSWLVLARSLWVAQVVFCWSIFIVSLPVYIARLQTVCIQGPCLSDQLRPSSALAFQQLGLSLSSYTAIVVTFAIITALVSFVVSVVLFWRKSDDWMALLVALALVQFIPVDTNALVLSNQAWRFPSECLSFLGGIWIFLTFSLFPNGRFVPRWMRWFTLGFLLLIGVSLVFPEPFDSSHWPPLLNLLITVALSGGVLGLFGGAQIYRYRRVSDLGERQQTKWVVFALSTFLLGLIAIPFVFYSLPQVFPAFLPPPILYQTLNFFWASLSSTLLPLSFGVAILHYHLWDIDLIINRTLVYGILTASVIGL